MSVDADEEPPLEPGRRVGNYVIDRLIGRGGFGTVYEATHPTINKRAAVKVLHLAASAKAELVSRFKAEARAVNSIDTKHVVDIFSFGTLDDGRFFYVMDLVDGESLRQMIKERERLPPGLLITILRPIAHALDAAHEAKIVHRDIKPANVLIAFDEDGQPQAKLADFGIAKLLDPGAAREHKTATGVPIGTPGYMSPEQCRAEPVDHRSDIYAIGVLCFEALTGRPPFVAASTVKLMMMHAASPPPAASSVFPPLGTAFDDELAAMLAKDPYDRPASVTECVERLAVAATLSSSLEPPVADAITLDTLAAADTVATLPPGTSKRPLLYVGAFIALVVVVTLMLPDRKPPREDAPAPVSTTAATTTFQPTSTKATATTMSTTASRSASVTTSTASSAPRRRLPPRPKVPPGFDPPKKEDLEF